MPPSKTPPSFNYPQLKLVAEHLDTKNICPPNCNMEAVHRTIVNRYYFYTYLHAREWVRVKLCARIVHPKLDGKSRSEHTQVTDSLKDNGYKNTSQKLISLKLKRKKADYDVDVLMLLIKKMLIMLLNYQIK
ncbi:MAG: hypothetical protein LBM96_12480 [Methanobrevibacter sp.]|jgi:hypothetical protein|nr:hypothetical protein [Candidatus Methanoflexus mossambicus]